MDDILNLALAFLEGLALILSPCILPILPIVLSGSLTGGVRRPFGIVTGFVIFFALFTLFSRALVEYLGINLDVLRQISYLLIIGFGIVLCSDYLSEKFNQLTGSIANAGQAVSGQGRADGFFSGVYLGLFISLIWVPCGGPILASAIIQTAVEKTSLLGFLSFLFFALGSAIPMLIIALTGRKIIGHLHFLKDNAQMLRKLFGLIIILAASYSIVSGTSAAYTDYQPIPATPNVVLPMNTKAEHTLINGLGTPYKAPLLDTQGTWINSPPLTLESLKGKVVLIDFWTYSCINCIRTLPYLNTWYEKYKKDGLVIIGVHTPEFEFEKNASNVQAAVEKFGITYPVVLDNNYVTWQHFHNDYWPAHYLIDKNGLVVYQHFGEGDNESTEYNIRALLGLNAKESTTTIKSDTNNTLVETPETYLGYQRAAAFYNQQEALDDEPALYQFPANLPTNTWSLAGKWLIGSEHITTQDNNARIEINFLAEKVFVVMGSAENKPVNVQVKLNGQPIGSKGGHDVNNNQFTVTTHRLYDVANVGTEGKGLLELVIEGAGVEIYTFTFG